MILDGDAMLWRLYFSFDGLVNYFLETIFHLKINWYGPTWALPAVIIVDIWEWTPSSGPGRDLLTPPGVPPG